MTTYPPANVADQDPKSVSLTADQDLMSYETRAPAAESADGPNASTIQSEKAASQAVAASTSTPYTSSTVLTQAVAGAPIPTGMPMQESLSQSVVVEDAIAMVKATEDAVSLAAIQEAATIVMEAENQKKRKSGAPPSSQPKKRSTPARVSWEDRLKQLEAYKQEHGNLLIPIRYKLNPSLGKFVHNTREQYKLFHKQTRDGYKKKCSLTAERIRQLEELGFAWTTQRTKQQNEDWQARLEQLQEFKNQHGHCLVPHGYTVDPSFAEWIHRQRTTYASMLKATKVNPVVKERMERLTTMGFNFSVHSDKWMDHWKQLKDYKEKHGVRTTAQGNQTILCRLLFLTICFFCLTRSVGLSSSDALYR